MAKSPNGRPEKPQKNNEQSKNYQQLLPPLGGFSEDVEDEVTASNGPPTEVTRPDWLVVLFLVYLYFMGRHFMPVQREEERRKLRLSLA